MADLSLPPKKSQEARLIQLFQTKCDEQGQMDIAHFICLVIERGMISNQYGLEVFHAAFQTACGGSEASGTNKKVGPKLDNTKFFYAILLLAKVLFYREAAPFEAMFQNMLVDKAIIGGEETYDSRLPKPDQQTTEAVAEIYSPAAIRTNIAYSDRLKKLFTEYLHLNHNAGKKTTTWKDISSKNTPMLARSFLKMCRCTYLIPHLIDVK